MNSETGHATGMPKTGHAIRYFWGVSTDEGKDSSNPAQSGIRNSKCFGSKGFNRCFQNAYDTNNLGYNSFNQETI